MKPTFIHIAVFSACLLVPTGSANAVDMGTAFTYQGRLTDGGSPANGPYDFEFELYLPPVVRPILQPNCPKK